MSPSPGRATAQNLAQSVEIVRENCKIHVFLNFLSLLSIFTHSSSIFRVFVARFLAKIVKS